MFLSASSTFSYIEIILNIPESSNILLTVGVTFVKHTLPPLKDIFLYLPITAPIPELSIKFTPEKLKIKALYPSLSKISSILVLTSSAL